jgi:hypothetical protein
MPNCVYTCISVGIHHQESMPIPVAARSKVWVCCRSPAEIAGLNPARTHGCLSPASVVLSGRGPCDGPITRTEACYRVCVCVDEGSGCCRDFYLTTYNIHKRKTAMPPVGFEPVTPASERPQTYTWDRAANRTGCYYNTNLVHAYNIVP